MSYFLGLPEFIWDKPCLTKEHTTETNKKKEPEQFSIPQFSVPFLQLVKKEHDLNLLYFETKLLLEQL